jgi:hypothetical protein
MNAKVASLVLLPIALGASGCFLSPIPDMRTAADHAHEMEQHCSGVSVPNLVIDSVEPAYSYVYAGPNTRESHMRGAKIRLRPGPGLTKESIQLALECHEALVTLGRAASPPEDPYFLPDTWLDIDVDSTGDGFVVRVLVDGLEDAQKVLARARHTAAEKGPGA